MAGSNYHVVCKEQSGEECEVTPSAFMMPLPGGGYQVAAVPTGSEAPPVSCSTTDASIGGYVSNEERVEKATVDESEGVGH